jgi:FMN-dependent oxidoreductase (nitrilotriacetate monooxygenase family)
MKKQIRFNAFEMNCIVHQAPGLWRHPEDRSLEYKSIKYWTDLAKTLEKGLFDGIFLADVLGVYDYYKGTVDPAIEQAIQLPVNDPLQIVPVMAAVTENLGFGLTCSVTFEHPFPFARRMSTLDHLTEGRVGWNIVTSHLRSGALNIGMEKQHEHDDRYEIADEYLDVLYKLWEGSWEQDAVLRDKEKGIFADPRKVHPIQHQGQYFKVPGIHLCEPSPQRTPVLYQAGASSRGQQFATEHAECMFISAPSKKVVKGLVKEIRQKLVEKGRDPYAIKIYTWISIVTDETDDKAYQKFKEYESYASYEGGLTMMSGWTAIDFSQFNPTDTLEFIETHGVQSILKSVTSADPDRRWTIEDIGKWTAMGGNGPVFVGSPSTVADTLEEWMEETDVDGFNIAYIVAHKTFEDIVEYIVPELQHRGIYPTEYAKGTLREKLFGQGALLQNHKATQYRVNAENNETVKASVA